MNSLDAFAAQSSIFVSDGSVNDEEKKLEENRGGSLETASRPRASLEYLQQRIDKHGSFSSRRFHRDESFSEENRVSEGESADAQVQNDIKLPRRRVSQHAGRRLLDGPRPKFDFALEKQRQLSYRKRSVSSPRERTPPARSVKPIPRAESTPRERVSFGNSETRRMKEKIAKMRQSNSFRRRLQPSTCSETDRKTNESKDDPQVEGVTQNHLDPKTSPLAAPNTDEVQPQLKSTKEAASSRLGRLRQKHKQNVKVRAVSPKPEPSGPTDREKTAPTEGRVTATKPDPDGTKITQGRKENYVVRAVVVPEEISGGVTTQNDSAGQHPLAGTRESQPAQDGTTSFGTQADVFEKAQHNISSVDLADIRDSALGTSMFDTASSVANTESTFTAVTATGLVPHSEAKDPKETVQVSSALGTLVEHVAENSGENYWWGRSENVETETGRNVVDIHVSSDPFLVPPPPPPGEKPKKNKKGRLSKEVDGNNKDTSEPTDFGLDDDAHDSNHSANVFAENVRRHSHATWNTDTFQHDEPKSRLPVVQIADSDESSSIEGGSPNEPLVAQLLDGQVSATRNETRFEAVAGGSESLFREKVISPVSSAKILTDSRLAVKVDTAISLAAEKLDHQVPMPNQPSKNEPGLIVELPSGPESSPPAKIARDSTATEASPHSAPVSKRYEIPEGRPSPFEAIVFLKPAVIGQILEFLGDPSEVCKMKGLNRTCFNYVEENQHKLMQTAVRLGGMNMAKRPAFWMWVLLSVSQVTTDNHLGDLPPVSESDLSSTNDNTSESLVRLQKLGEIGKWSLIIERDVARSFGNLPPHKTGARLRTDSIVRALVSWGRNRTIKSGVRGAGPAPSVAKSDSVDSDDVSITPTDTVSDWGGVSPSTSFGAASFSSNKSEQPKVSATSKQRKHRRSDDELALSGNVLTDETRKLLQKKLSFILHALSAAHPAIGYCQGMDYVVAHLLRLLQDTVRWQAANGTLPPCISSGPKPFSFSDTDQTALAEFLSVVDGSLVLEETCFRMMNVLLTNYNLGHFYWPELRCLKTCCRVFEKLIQIKLPVLADHFEHHELNVGLFALGWFQTLFLYLPSMPSATVCHMWDIWLVERSFKIFFRVATAILFLSQPILLNHELEGMMSYLNTFPDATLLSPDILIACALQIKVTNRMIMELEQQVVNET